MNCRLRLPVASLCLLLVLGACSKEPESPVADAVPTPAAVEIPCTGEDCEKLEITKGDLTYAAYAGDLVKVRELIRRGANVNERVGIEGNQFTPLMAALVASHQEVAAALVDAGADRNVRFQNFSPTMLHTYLCSTNSARCWPFMSRGK